MPNWNTMAPYEIIASPADLWIAPALTARPVMTAHPLPDPIAPWAKVGTSLSLNYTEDGVTIQMQQDVVKWRSLGDTGSRKAFRTLEDAMARVNVADMTLEAWANILNANAITTVAAGAGTAGYKKIGLSKGPGVASFAVLIRFPSPYVTAMWSQLWMPIAINSASTEFPFKKDTPAALAIEFSAMVNTAAANEFERFGVLEAQSALPV